MGTVATDHSLEQRLGHSERFSGRWSGGKSRRGHPVTLRHDGRTFRVRILCMGQRTAPHRHEAITAVAGRTFTAVGRTQDEALAVLIKAIDPEVETVRDERGSRLA
jgi:hypothetical protein